MIKQWAQGGVQSLLLRSLVSRFWQQPYEQPLVSWGTELHDRFMLPHYVQRDLADVVNDLNRNGFPFDLRWFDPFVEFRFPRYGTLNVDDIELELRFAIEPWNVLGEEVTALGTADLASGLVGSMGLGASNSLAFDDRGRLKVAMFDAIREFGQYAR